MTLTEFAKLVKEMRDAQNKYFNPQTRTRSAMDAAKLIERKVDEEIKKIIKPDNQMKLL